MTNKFSALVLGATGLVGSHLLKQLLENNSYEKVTILVRKLMDVEHPKLQQVELDFQFLDDYLGYFGVDHVFCCLGTTQKIAGGKAGFRKVDFELVFAAAQIAREARAQKFIFISSLGANAKSRNFYLRTKGEAENAIFSLGIAKAIAVRPSLLIGEREGDFRFAESLGIAASRVFNPIASLLLPSSAHKYLPIKAEEVANFMIAKAIDKPTPVTIEFVA